MKTGMRERERGREGRNKWKEGGVHTKGNVWKKSGGLVEPVY